MRPFSQDHLIGRWRKVQQGLKHAFSTQAPSPPLSREDLELMERIADVLVKRRLAAPAAVFLDSMGPMSFLGSQALHLLTPVLECAFKGGEIERVARLLERRDTITRLVALIESKTSTERASAR